MSSELYISSNGISLDEELSLISSDKRKGLKQKHFSDAGARAYTSAARYEFQKYSYLKGLNYTNALEELSKIAIKYQYDFELISKIFMGNYVITANEIADAVKETGKYPLHILLQEWSSDPLHSLSKVLVGAIVIPSNEQLNFKFTSLYNSKYNPPWFI